MMPNFSIEQGDCLDILRSVESNSFDSIVTDPPYGLSREPDPIAVMSAWCKNESYHHKARGFMGNEWDAFVPQPEYWKEALRVLKPGGYALVFAGSRTQDWMTMSLRFAGFEIVDTIMWVYSQGMPKSHNISKAIDKMAPATGEASQWEGWGTQLKPSYEPILLCRKPCDGTFAKNVLKHGVGGINIDACRVHAADAVERKYSTKRHAPGSDVSKQGKWKSDVSFDGVLKAGRWPANFLHDGSDEVVANFPITGGKESAARFFYCAKPSPSERHWGTGHISAGVLKRGSTLRQIERAVARSAEGNTHPTIKPIKLMTWLCKLITPPGGDILDLFCGSGTTGISALQGGFNFKGIELSANHASVARSRCNHALQEFASR